MIVSCHEEISISKDKSDLFSIDAQIIQNLNKKLKQLFHYQSSEHYHVIRDIISSCTHVALKSLDKENSRSKERRGRNTEEV